MDDTQTPTNQTDSTEDSAFVSYEPDTDSDRDPSGGTSDAMALLDLERTIKTYHKSIIMKQQELKKFKEMITDTLEGDQVYGEHETMVNDAKQILKATRDQLMAVGSVVSTLEEMKEISSEMKELKTHLSDQLMRYYDSANANSITMDDGETYMIQAQAKLVKQSSKYRP